MYNMYRILGLVLAVVSSCAADSCGRICDFNDNECLLRGLKNEYRKSVQGVDGLRPYIDPLLIYRVRDGDTELSKIQFAGLDDCDVKKIRLDASARSYDYHINCPQLVIQFNYLNEVITVMANNGLIHYIGNFDYYLKGKEQKLYFYIKHLNASSLYYDELNTVQKSVDGEEVDPLPENTIKSMVALIAKYAMRILMDQHDAFLSVHPCDEVLPDC